MNRAQTRSLLARRGLRLRRELGQNFLVDEPQARRLAELAGVAPGDVVLEIGTGLGALTRALAERASRVVTLEIDSGVAAALREESLLPPGVELHHADALEVPLAPLMGGAPRERAKLVANLPYSAATPLLRTLLDLRECFCCWSVMLQREVALRLAARPGERDYGSFAVLHALAARVELVAELPASAFFPEPRVVSSFVRITPLREAEISSVELRAVERVARAAFGQRRKTLANALRGGGLGERSDAAIEEVGVDPRARAETLAPDVFRRLAAVIAPGLLMLGLLLGPGSHAARAAPFDSFDSFDSFDAIESLDPLANRAAVYYSEIYDATAWLVRVPYRLARPVVIRAALGAYVARLELDDSVRARVIEHIEAPVLVDEIVPFLLALKQTYTTPRSAVESFDTQLIDFLVNRSGRSSLLVCNEARLARELSASALAELQFGLGLRDSEPARDAFVGRDEDMQRVIAQLVEDSPQSVPYQDLAARGLTNLSSALLGLVSRGFVDPRYPC